MTNTVRVIRVAVPLPIEHGLDYRWSAAEPVPRPGCRVRVPVGTRTHTGVVIDSAPSNPMRPERLKAASEALDHEPIIDAGMLATLRWCADYYHHPIGEVISAAVPGLLRRGRSATATPEVYWELTAAGREVDTAERARRAPKQAAVLESFGAAGPLAQTRLRELGFAPAQLAKLRAKGWLKRAAQTPAVISAPQHDPPPHPVLTSGQRRVLEAIADAPAGYRAFLLHGVTGSGKTEIYMRLISEQLERGRQSLLLVPEISLTPQLVGRLEQRFGDRLAVMHSALTDTERLEAWRLCRLGLVGVIVGTRSAVFAPLRDPALIIIDEEHDASYKQAEGLRYSARDVAVYRAQQLGVPVLLGSATPSLESFHNAEQRRYQLLALPARIGSAGKPDIRLIDLNQHAARQGLSTPLIDAIERHLVAGNQIMLFLNRRGFAPVLFCPDCREAEECHRCDSRLTIHAGSGRLRCHHCGAERTLAWACVRCGAERVAVGAGTQRVGDELRTLFPDAQLARLDRDATAKRGSLASVLAEVEQGKTRILVGTQMLAKGHDFPNVTLVGVLNADQGLFGTDFRSNERLAQTIIQVAGRAGRADRPGEVLIQSHFLGHPLFECLLAQDYPRFIALALAERRAADWPPFSHLILWRAQAISRAAVFACLNRLATAARQAGTTVAVHGPAPAAMERRGGRYRAHVLLQCAQRRPLHALVDKLLPLARAWPETRKVRLAIDVDPVEL